MLLQRLVGRGFLLDSLLGLVNGEGGGDGSCEDGRLVVEVLGVMELVRRGMGGRVSLDGEVEMESELNCDMFIIGCEIDRDIVDSSVLVVLVEVVGVYDCSVMTLRREVFGIIIKVK